jgi:hypothetical protein
MRPVAEWDETDLQTLIDNEVQESLMLDYKRSDALSKNDKKKSELSKDISAFANSAGGMLIYGLEENGHVPTAIDMGVNATEITKEWLESVIKTNIRPIVDQILIKQISLPNRSPNAVAYVIEIGQATSRAPHQASDRRYYKRFNFESTPMEDYEVRDLMRRSIEYGKKYADAWNLNVEVRRFLSAIEERLNYRGRVRQDRAIIRVSDGLRSAGSAVMAFDRSLRYNIAELVNSIDGLNHKIEIENDLDFPNQISLRGFQQDLKIIEELAIEITDALGEILDSEP